MADDQVKYSDLLVKDEDVFGALIKEINDTKKAMADLKQEAAGFAGSVRNAGTATRDQQQAVAADATEIERLSKQVKALTDKLAKLETKKKNYKKLTDEETASVEALRQALAGSAQDQIAAVQAIDMQTKSYNELYQTYNAIKDALNAMTLAERENSDAGKVMVQRSKEIYDTLNNLQQATGKYTLNVGNYQSAFGRLQFQAQQLMREAPSAISLQQFFLAISNNLPMFTDALSNFKAATKDMKARLKEVTEEMNALKKSMEGMEEGSEAFEDAKEKLGDLTEEQKNLKGQSMSTGKALVKSIVSWQTAILVGIMLLQKFGTKIVEMFANIFKGTKDAIDETKLYAEMNEQAASSVGEMTAKYEALRKEWQNLKAEDQGRWLEKHKNDWNELGMVIDDAKQAEDFYVNNTDAVQEAIDKRARSIAGMKLAAEKYEQAFKKQVEAEQITDKKRTNFGSMLVRALAGAGMAESNGVLTSDQMNAMQRAEEQASLYKKAMDEVKKLQEEARAYLGFVDEDKSITSGGGDEEKRNSEQSLEDRYWEAEKSLLEAQYEGYQLERQLAKLNRDKARDEQINWYVDQRLALDENLKNGFITQEKYDQNLAELDRQNKALRKAIDKKYWDDLRALRMKNLADRKKEWKSNSDAIEKEEKENAKTKLKAMADGWQEERAKLVEQGATRKRLIKAEVDAEIARLNMMLELNRTVNGEIMSDEEKAKVKEWIALLEKMQKTGKYGNLKPGQVAGKGAANVTADKSNYTSATQMVADVLGIDISQEQISALNSVFDQAKAALNSWMDARKAAADQAKELADDEVSSAEQALNREIELRNQGYANDVALREKELANAKANQKKALEMQQKAKTEELAINTALEASNMAVAVANLFKQFPVYVAIPLAAVMLGAWGVAKYSAISKVKSTKYKQGGVMLLEGGSHESGHDVNLGIGPDGSNLRAEGGEYFAVINKRNSRKYGSEIPAVVNALNRGVFEDKYIKTSDAVGLMGNVGVVGGMGESADLSRLEDGVGELVKQGEQKWSVEGDWRVMRYKNLTRRVKVNA